MDIAFPAPASAPTTAQCDTLDQLPSGRSALVLGLRADDGPAAQVAAEVSRRLKELGFVAGERVRVLHRGMPGGEPIAVRVGSSTFALRRFEAALVAIVPEA